MKLSFKELQKIDRIEITNEDIQIIRKWYIKNLNYIKNKVNEIKMPFEEVVIVYADNIVYKKNETFMTAWENPDNPSVELDCVYGFDLNFENHIENIANNNCVKFQAFYDDEAMKNCKDLEAFKVESEKWISQDIEVITLISVYMNLNQEYIIKQTKNHTKKIQSKKDKRAGKKPKTKITKQTIITLNTDHIQPPTEEEKREYERHTFGWTVRGHWREYKSGNKIWIKPQVRGDKDQVEGKVYEI